MHNIEILLPQPITIPFVSEETPMVLMRLIAEPKAPPDHQTS